MVNFLLGQQVALQNIVKKKKKNILVSSVCGTAEPKRDTGNKTWKRLACKKTPLTIGEKNIINESLINRRKIIPASAH